MEFLKSIWTWVKSALGFAPGARVNRIEDHPDELTPEDRQHVAEALDAILAEVEQEEVEEEDDTYESSIPAMAVRMRIAKAIARRAEEFEADQSAFVEFLQDNGREDVLVAINQLVNWDAVFSDYSEKTLNLLVGRGTNIQLNMAHARLMRRLAELERAERFAVEPPETNGMGDDGKPH